MPARVGGWRMGPVLQAMRRGRRADARDQVRATRGRWNTLGGGRVALPREAGPEERHQATVQQGPGLPHVARGPLETGN